MRIHTNVISLQVHRGLSLRSEQQQRLQGRLASGLRITGGSDDPAGLGLSERLRAQTRSYLAAERNLTDALGLLAAVAGHHHGTLERLGRMNQLVVQALDGGAAPERALLAAEFSALARRTDDELAGAVFNGIRLFPGSRGSLSQSRVGGGFGVAAFDPIRLVPDARSHTFQAGVEDDSTIEVRYSALHGPRAQLLALDLEDAADRASALGVLARARGRVLEGLGDLGSGMNRMQSALRSAMTARGELSAAGQRVRGLDVARATAELARTGILRQVSVRALGLASLQPALALRLLC